MWLIGWYIERHDITGTKRKISYMMQGSLAERLRILRAREGLTLTEASERIGITRHTLSSLERGGQEPHYPTLAKIAKGYGVPVEELLEEPVAAGKAEAPDQGQPETEQTARDIAHAEARRQDARDRKAARRTLASEGIDPATRISDVYDPAVYDVLRRRSPDELAGALLDAERDHVHAVQECALQEEKIAHLRQVEEGNGRLREENARLRQDIAELRSEAEREGIRR
jgi:transcriptional regulator with XRE-family HTH domain